MDKREKERKERTKVEFVVATKKSDSLGRVFEACFYVLWHSLAPV